MKEAEIFPTYARCFRCKQVKSTADMLMYTRGYLCRECLIKELEENEAEDNDSSNQDRIQ